MRRAEPSCDTVRPNIVKEEIKWSQHNAMSYLVTTELRGIDRQGILPDLAKVASADFNINIREVNIHSHDGIFEGNVSLYVKDAESPHADGQTAQDKGYRECQTNIELKTWMISQR